MHISILLQSRHELGPFFLHSADGHRERLKQGVGDAKTGRSSCRKGATNQSEKIFERQILGREADNYEKQILQKLSGDPRVLVDVFLLPLSPEMISVVYAGPCQPWPIEFDDRKGRKKANLLAKTFPPKTETDTNIFRNGCETHFRLCG